MISPANDLAIVICTFRRNGLLRTLLANLAAQERPEGLSARVYVVDNSDEGSARETVETAARTSLLKVDFVAAHPANIAVARNAGVRASSERFLAFVDDDQTLEPGWLKAVALAIEDENFDAWLGRVVGDFEAPEAATAATRRLFSRDCNSPGGRELFAFGPRKSSDITLGSGNSIFRRATTLTDAQVFNPAFGHGGGEDYDLFCRLQRGGRRFVWTPEAAVREFVPASRCDHAYLRRRFYAGGQAFAAAVACGGAAPVLSRWIIRAKSLVQAGLLAGLAPALLLQDRGRRADYGFRWAGVLGKLSFGGIYPLYRDGN
jgi:succinoglycan biosynthesis protein ExoM